ncbi:MAG: hypothetical protein NC122_04390 [Faecalibacterium sp.]|nr:hypothetical protein [Ruminococcus sp.]MCM1485422.1 hypothetical protein [Faecalibacterium sp.]
MAADNLAYEYYTTNAVPNSVPNTAPQRKPEDEKKPELKKLKKQRPNVRQQEKGSYARIAKFSIPVVLAIALFAVLCNSFTLVRSSRFELRDQQELLGVYLDQKTEVEARLAKLVSVDRIEEIAVEKLGMVKISDENKLYVNTADENEIIVSGEKN